MLEAAKQHRAHPRRRRLATAGAGVATATLAVAAFAAAVALAAPGLVRINSTSNSKLGERVTVNAQGLTLYALSPETASHLLCKSSECLSFWPPVTVPSRKTKLKAGSGVQGRLGVFRRSDGRLQVTLRGLPLYRFAKDRTKGEANGQGINSFGGTWHAVSASASLSSPSPPPSGPPPSSPPPSSPPPGYGYGY
jgi:predicted lipoprotein with Yx(FWY)xxD motif